MLTKFIYLLVFSVMSTVIANGQNNIPTFQAAEIDSKVDIGYGVAVADVNGDNKPDILLADKNLIVWYQNPTWEKHIIAEKLTTLDHVAIAARDIDGDGKAEVAVGAGWNPNDTTDSGSVHYLIAPADRTQKWKPIALPHEPTVHRMRWVKNATGKFELVVVPLHGRGNKAGEGEGVKILAYQVPSDITKSWSTELLDDSLHMTHNFDPVEWDKKNEDELLIAGKEGVFVLNRAGSGSTIIKLTNNVSGGAGEVRHGKLPGGNRFIATVEPMHGNLLVTYTAPPVGKNSLWNRNVIDSTLKEGHALGCGDLLGIGYDQIVVGWRARNSEGKVGILLFTPLDKEGRRWRKSVIDDNTMACEDLCIADLNGDGKLDIVAAGRATKNLKIYFNRSVK